MQVISVWLINGNENRYRVFDNFTEDAPVHAYFQDKNESFGYYHLSVVQNEAVATDDFIAARIAGYAEGYLTYRQMNAFAQNAMVELEITADMLDHVARQWTFIDQYGQKSVKVIKSWHQGLYEGYQQACEAAGVTALSREKLWIISSVSDMEDLEAVFTGVPAQKDRPTHCTGMIIATPDFRDAFFSHVTWNSFQSGFIRIVKDYAFQWSLGKTVQQNVHFSSYPGQFSSVDDFYIVNNVGRDGQTSNLAILETTYGIKDTSIYENIIIPTNENGEAVLTWLRVMTATLSSLDAAQWYDEFVLDASWTYNNNYLFLDYQLYDQTVTECGGCSADELRGRIAAKEGILQSLEVVPPDSLNYSEAQIKPLLFSGSEFLAENRFFISMNTPINMSLFLYLGYDPDDTYYGFNNSARLNITQHLAADVHDFKDFKWFMRYNDYTSVDNFQKNDSGDGISSRYDLRDNTYVNISIHGPSQFGATDCKVTSLSRALRGEFDILIGQTTGNENNYPVYNFSEHTDEIQVVGVHEILPMEWDTAYACGGVGFLPGCQGCREHFLIESICNECEEGFHERDGDCIKSSNAGIICAIVIPISLLVICLLVWYFVYRRTKAAPVVAAMEEKEQLVGE